MKTLNEDLESKNNTLDESLNSINISNELLSFSINNSKKINDFINHNISNRISDIYLQLENAINYYDYDKHDELGKALLDLNKQIKSTDELIKDLVLMSSSIDTQGLNTENHEIKEVIDRSVNTVSDIFKLKSIKLEIDNSYWGPLYCQIDLIITTMRNLLSNAFKNSEPGSTVKIHTYENDNNIYVSVINEGKIIPNEVLDDIFSFSFNKDSKLGEGTGIGLYLSKEIMKLHDGDIYLKSNVSGQIEFTLVSLNILSQVPNKSKF